MYRSFVIDITAFAAELTHLHLSVLSSIHSNPDVARIHSQVINRYAEVFAAKLPLVEFPLTMTVSEATALVNTLTAILSDELEEALTQSNPHDSLDQFALVSHVLETFLEFY